MKRAISALAGALLLASAAAGADKPSGTLVELTVQASRSASNDLAQATAFAEAAGASPAEVARRVNAAIAAAMQVARRHPAVKLRSGASYTHPVYAKGGQRIESWRMHSELLLESRDPAALAELLGALQASLGVSQLQFQPSPETRRAAEDEATLEGIAAFRARAKLVADALGKPFRIRQLHVAGAAQRPPVHPLQRSAMAEAAAAPMPVEAGESAVTVTVSGQIELPE